MYFKLVSPWRKIFSDVCHKLELVVCNSGNFFACRLFTQADSHIFEEENLKMRIAIIGTGISGSLTARLLSTQHEVTLFEANHYAGGHANTVDAFAFGKHYAIDTGFMVFNRQTYPNFCRLLQLLKVRSQPSDMSFSVRCCNTGLEYQGSSLNGLFAQRLNLFRPSFLNMIRDITGFNKLGTETIANGNLQDGRTVGEFISACGLGNRFVQHYLVPMASAIWSARPQSILEFPAKFMLGFFANHGLMQLSDRPQWRTITGGSKNYVESLLNPIRDRLRLNCPIASVARFSDGVLVTPRHGEAEYFDEVVFATHADLTLDLLSDATVTEKQILGAFPYQASQAVLHTDLGMLPKRRRAWASWNYHIPKSSSQNVSVTYDLSRLQKLNSPSPILLTLNDIASIDQQKVLQTFNYHHPAYSCHSIIAQQKFHEINGHNRTHFCGAYWGYGFHEDGVNSALAVASHFGIELESCIAASTKERSHTTAASL